VLKLKKTEVILRLKFIYRSENLFLRSEILNSLGGKGAFVSDHGTVLKKWQEEFDYSKNKSQDKSNKTQLSCQGTGF